MQKDKTPKGSVDVASFYDHCVRKVTQCEERNDAEGAMVWLRQAEFLGCIVLKRDTLPEVTAAYVRLISRTAKKARDLAVTSGNITTTHEKLTGDLRTMASQLRLRLANDEQLLARAVVIEGLCVDASRHVANFRRHDPLYTSATDADTLIDGLNAVMLNVSDMGVDVDAVYGTDIELLDLARTSVSNAQHTLPWFLPTRFQDWSKAEFHARRATKLLAQHIATETSASGSEPELDAIHATLNQAEQALSAHDRKAAQTALNSAYEALTSFIANQ